MTDVDALKRTIKVCMFDQYGTVVDMQGGLTAIAAPFLKSKGWTGDPNSFVTWWRRTHFEIGLPMLEILFVANHAFDCIGAKSAGMRTAFINLRQRPFGMTPHQPDLNVSTMTGLADALV